MTFKLIRGPKQRSSRKLCHRVPLLTDFPPGAIVECEDCHKQYKKVSDPNTIGGWMWTRLIFRRNAVDSDVILRGGKQPSTPPPPPTVQDQPPKPPASSGRG